MESFETGRPSLLPTRVFDWNREPDSAHPRTPLPVARWLRPLPRRRSAPDEAHRTTRRTAGRPTQDDRGAEPALHDHLDRPEKPLTRSLANSIGIAPVRNKPR